MPAPENSPLLPARPSTAILVAANMAPLVGVLGFGWDVLGVLLLYWAETVIIGVLNVIRMLVCSSRGLLSARLESPPLTRTGSLRYRNLPGLHPRAAKLFLIPFFIVHYGAFAFGHLLAVVGLFSEHGFGGELDAVLPELWQPYYWLPLGAIAASHLYSFMQNFIGAGEYLRTNASQLMMQPYARVVALHVAIIGGAALIRYFGDPLAMLLLLIAVKIVLDLRLHERERRQFAETAPTDREME